MYCGRERDFPISSVQPLSHVRLFVTPWIAAPQASLSITNSWSLLKLMSIESVMPSSHLILCRPPLLLPPIPPSIRVFSNESTLCMRWQKYWSFSFNISPSNEYPRLISFRMDWLDLFAVQGISLYHQAILEHQLSYNATQFWQYPPRDSIRLHKLRAQSFKTPSEDSKSRFVICASKPIAYKWEVPMTPLQRFN